MPAWHGAWSNTRTTLFYQYKASCFITSCICHMMCYNNNSNNKTNSSWVKPCFGDHHYNAQNKHTKIIPLTQKANFPHLYACFHFILSSVSFISVSSTLCATWSGMPASKICRSNLAWKSVGGGMLGSTHRLRSGKFKFTSLVNCIRSLRISVTALCLKPLSVQNCNSWPRIFAYSAAPTARKSTIGSPAANISNETWSTFWISQVSWVINSTLIQILLTPYFQTHGKKD